MRIVFMGTPDFAVPSLRQTHASAHDVLLVVTQPDRPAGRGRRLTPPPVKTAAGELDIPVHQTESVNTPVFAERLRALLPDVLVVVAFGQILNDELLSIPSKGAVNVHGSVLPAYRGVAPINWVIVNGETETGVTTMYMARKVDAGEIILTRRTPIGENETAGELYDRLSAMGAELLVETLDLIERDEAPRTSQDPDAASYARKLKKRDGLIDWTKDARTVHDHIRGMTPWPGARTTYRGRPLTVLVSRVGDEDGERGEPGEVVSLDDERGIEVATGHGSVRLLEVKPSGKSAMDAASFVRGYRPEVGERPFGETS
ncbi:MAG: methionyl-tRNA formyltransferase [Candidatus Eisenbacteria bacterium]|nr:methionyl-tRNA formyltransferase [Candidatus Eisenbacteria bacterium]